MQTTLTICFLALLAFAKCAPAYDSLDSDDYSNSDYINSDGLDTYDYYGQVTAEEGMYQCRGDYISIEISRLCNGQLDCPRGEDEELDICNRFSIKPTVDPLAASTTPPTTTPADLEYPDYGSCAEDEFQCRSDPGICVPKITICDGHGDCPDSEDELYCGVRNVVTNLVVPDVVPAASPEAELRSSGTQNDLLRTTLSNCRDANLVRHGAKSSTRSGLLPRLIFKPTPEASVLHEAEREHSAEMNLVHRFSARPERLTGESGETNVADHLPDLHALSDESVESALEQMAQENTIGVLHEPGRDESTLHVADAEGTAQTPSSDADAYEDVTISSTVAASSSLMPPSQPFNSLVRRLPKKSTAASQAASEPLVVSHHRRRMKGLLGQMMKQVGKIIATEGDSRNIDLNVKIGPASGNSRTSSNDRPRLSFSLQMDL